MHFVKSMKYLCALYIYIVKFALKNMRGASTADSKLWTIFRERKEIRADQRLTRNCDNVKMRIKSHSVAKRVGLKFRITTIYVFMIGMQLDNIINMQ